MSDNFQNTPASVTVIFPRADFGSINNSMRMNSGIRVEEHFTLNVAGTGHAGTQIIHSTAIANFQGGSDPVNLTELQDLADAISAAFFTWRLASLEIRYESVVDWQMSGMEDVEYLHGYPGISTSIHRSEFEPDNGELQHAGSFGSSAQPPICGAQGVQIATGDLVNGVYDAVLLLRDNDSQADLEDAPIWVYDWAGSTSLSAGAQYNGVFRGIEPRGPYYLSIVNPNLGHALTDTAAWKLLLSLTPTVWSAGTYDYGSYVSDSGHNWVQTNAAGTTETPGSGGDWLQADVLNASEAYFDWESYTYSATAGASVVQEARAVHSIGSSTGGGGGGSVTITTPDTHVQTSNFVIVDDGEGFVTGDGSHTLTFHDWSTLNGGTLNTVAQTGTGNKTLQNSYWRWTSTTLVGGLYPQTALANNQGMFVGLNTSDPYSLYATLDNEHYYSALIAEGLVSTYNGIQGVYNWYQWSVTDIGDDANIGANGTLTFTYPGFGGIAQLPPSSGGSASGLLGAVLTLTGTLSNGDSDPYPRYAINDGLGAYGTDAIGNVFAGGIIISVGISYAGGGSSTGPGGGGTTTGTPPVLAWLTFKLSGTTPLWQNGAATGVGNTGIASVVRNSVGKFTVTTILTFNAFAWAQVAGGDEIEEVTGTRTANSFTFVTLSGLDPVEFISVIVTGNAQGATVGTGGAITTVTASMQNLALNATTVVITGTGFNTTFANNTLYFGGVGGFTVASGTVNSTTVTVNGVSYGPGMVMTLTLTPTATTIGTVTLSVTNTVTGASSGVQVPVWAFVATPTLNASSQAIQNVLPCQFSITGTGFVAGMTGTITSPGGNTVGSITFLSATLATVIMSAVSGTGNLSMNVTCNGGVSNTAVVAVLTASAAPYIMPNPTAVYSTTTTTITIFGDNLPTTAHGSVTLYGSGSPTGTYAQVSSTQATLTVSGLAVGTLYAVVKDSSTGLTSFPYPSTVIGQVQPVGAITSNTQTIADNCYGYAIPVSGNGFAAFTATAGGLSTAAGSLDAALISSTQLTLTPVVNNPFADAPVNLTMQLTPAGAIFGPTQIATAVNVSVTLNSASIAATAATVTIAGNNFDPSIVGTSGCEFFSTGGYSWYGIVISVNLAGTSMVVAFNGPGQPLFTGGEQVNAIVASYHGNSGGSSGLSGVEIGVISGAGGGGPTVATPTFSPAAGTYSSAQSVYLLESTPGASIWYTTDGSTPTFPTTGTTAFYVGPLSVSLSETIKAIGQLAGYATSGVGSATYLLSWTMEFGVINGNNPPNGFIPTSSNVGITNAGTPSFAGSGISSLCVAAAYRDLGTTNNSASVSFTFNATELGADAVSAMVGVRWNNSAQEGVVAFLYHSGAPYLFLLDMTTGSWTTTQTVNSSALSLTNGSNYTISISDNGTTVTVSIIDDVGTKSCNFNPSAGGANTQVAFGWVSVPNTFTIVNTVITNVTT